MASAGPRSIAEHIQQSFERLTPTERKSARVLLANYPFVGLETVAEFAKRSDVSGPTILRLVAKLGYSSYTEFQRVLRGELEARLQSPLAKAAAPDNRRPGAHGLVDQFAEAVCGNIRQAVRHLPRAEFEAVVELLADDRRRVLLVGGRFTDALARYLYSHLQVLRAHVQHLSEQPSSWPEVLLDVGKRDVLVVFDIRRYQDDLNRLSQQVAGCGATVVLFTDQWLSPIAKVAKHIFSTPIDVPSNWDSSVATLAIVEAMITALNNRQWSQVKQRIERLEALRQKRLMP